MWADCFRGIVKGVQAVTLSDDQVVGYVAEYVHYSDSVNEVLPPIHIHSASRVSPKA